MSASGEAPAEVRLVKNILSGDDEAFAALVRKHKGKVFGIVAKFVRNNADLDDICQEVFLKVYQNLKHFRGDAPLEHWVSKIAVNTCYDFLRKRRKMAEVPLEDVAFALSNPVAEYVSGRDAWNFLQRALSQLLPEERMVITLLNLEEKSVREVSALTGWSEAKVKVRAFRARQALKRILDDNNGKRST